jgi:hypothetical protein
MRRLYSVLIAHTVSSYAAFTLAMALQRPVPPIGISGKSFERMNANTPADPDKYVEMVLLPPILGPLIFVDYSVGSDRFLRFGKIDTGPLAFVLAYPTVGLGGYLLLRRLHGRTKRATKNRSNMPSQ